jgi:hypothetical protein
MTSPNLTGVPLLLPARVKAAREAVMTATLADLSALIDALPTATPGDSGTLSDNDTAQTKAWAQSVISALPTSGADHGNC